jgi:hypothetical protein
MPQSRLQDNPVGIDWDGLGQFQSLDVPLLFLQVMEISASRMADCRLCRMRSDGASAWSAPR